MTTEKLIILVICFLGFMMLFFLVYSMPFDVMLKKDLAVSKYKLPTQKYESGILRYFYFNRIGMVPTSHLWSLWIFTLSFLVLEISFSVGLILESLICRVIVLICIVVCSISVFYSYRFIKESNT